ncbi:MAG: AraC family transcriptional regulator [Pigmentiphaga sp.]|nr:AraC family transcriptional regulator [Pigmentiphaga sp.]
MTQLKVWDTRGLAPRQALTFWNEAVCSAFLDVRTESQRTARSFRASLQALDFGSLAVNRLRAQSYRVIRGTEGGSAGWVFVNLHQRGRCRLRQHGREHWIEAGGVSLNLGDAPFDFDFDGQVAMTCLRLPLSGLAARTGRLHAAAARPLAEGAATRLFMDYTRSLLANIDALRPHEAGQAATCLLDLLALSIDGSGASAPNTRASQRQALFRQASAYLAAHLGNPALDLAALAGHLRMAPRTLQTLFREQGTTFTECLLEHRLAAAERLLANDSGEPLAQIAYAVGFADQSYFNRAFRQRFGLTPGQRRRQAAAAILG